MNSEKVWLSDPAQGFILGKIVEFAEDGPVVQPIDRFFFTIFLKIGGSIFNLIA